eukprot:gnl/TRDRNA2_/TRDRNA2_157228_c1_seq1.p1 gnl/TRDRNA2_/TRDRNA2_157228_c1~~gnl/TRDRNA2_/TRDRNA2_157228_c1_seq1.p1  ORF type:complete len:607 (-),score=171.80 gnl/TRDRNA2_/TRDRNA2_157228_c1_seq1:96-1916(-)
MPLGAQVLTTAWDDVGDGAWVPPGGPHCCRSVHRASFAAGLVHRPWRRVLAPSAFAGAQGLPEEEERMEPSMTELREELIKENLAKNKALSQASEVSRVLAVRKAQRGAAAEEVANTKAKASRKEAEDLYSDMEGTTEEKLHRLQVANAKQGAIKAEIAGGKKQLEADAVRDEAIKTSKELEEKQDEIEKAQTAVSQERELRLEATRNTAPGTPARDCHGVEILTKKACEEERNTVFKDNRCVVVGDTCEAQSPEEQGALSAVAKAKGELDAKRDATLQANQQLQNAARTLKEAEQEVAELRKRNPKVRPGSETERQIAQLESKAAQAKAKAANTSTRDAALAEERTASEAYVKELKSILELQKGNMKKVEEATEKVQAQVKEAAETSKAEDAKRAEAEAKEAATIQAKSNEVSAEAKKHAGTTEGDQLELEAKQLHAQAAWSQKEAQAVQAGDMKQAERDHENERELATKAAASQKLAVREAATIGESEPQIDPKLEVEEKEENEKLSQAYANGDKAEENRRQGLEELTTAESEKNCAALRLELTESALKKEEAQLAAKSSSLEGALPLAVLLPKCAMANVGGTLRQRHPRCAGAVRQAVLSRFL